ncbi:MAG: MBL fold metallo-hydrolase [Planctomycetota bacterium]|jgi:ribonuclease BN (tRNA processing enzyme)
MIIYSLGSGTPDPLAERFGSAFILEKNNERILIDCGPAATYKMALMDIKPQTVSSMFITHHHFDHNADAPCFALTWWDQNSDNDNRLNIYGPPSTAEFIDKLIGENGAFADDWKARIDLPASKVLHQNRGGTLPRPAPDTRIKAFDVEDGQNLQSENWKISCHKVHHAEPWLESLVFRFESENESVVFTGDAGACPELTDICRGTKVLVLCCAYDENINPDVRHVVTGADCVAEIAGQTNAETIILTHQNSRISRPENREETVATVSKNFSGTVIFADELKKYEV